MNKKGLHNQNYMPFHNKPLSGKDFSLMQLSNKKALRVESFLFYRFLPG